MTISRAPLREEVYRALVRRLVQGEFEPGGRLSDSVLAGELGVSRTPVREALVQLEREGYLAVEVGRGFFVRPLTAAQLREAAPIVAALEGLALRSCHPLPARVLSDLDGVNEQAAGAAQDPERAVWLNLRWHQVLVEACPNQHLRGLIGSLARMLRRYAHAYWKDTGRVRLSVANHAAVTAALRRGEVDEAVRMLEGAWGEGVEEMARWLEG